MIDKFNVPEEHQTAFRRLLRILPDSFREDEKKMQTLLIYLKLGGERLARLRLEIAKRPFQREFALFKRIQRELLADEGGESDDEENDDADEAGIDDEGDGENGDVAVDDESDLDD